MEAAQTYKSRNKKAAYISTKSFTTTESISQEKKRGAEKEGVNIPFLIGSLLLA